MPDAEANGKNGRQISDTLRMIGAGLVLSYLTASTTWIVIHSAKISSLETQRAADSERISALETGRTTPMAESTRLQFDAVRREIESLKSYLK